MARKQKDDIGQPTKDRSIPLAAPESLPKAFQFKREAKQREQRTTPFQTRKIAAEACSVSNST
jgi:hypothetical protein